MVLSFNFQHITGNIGDMQLVFFLLGFGLWFSEEERRIIQGLSEYRLYHILEVIICLSF
jgi:hypothetical protein